MTDILAPIAAAVSQAFVATLSHSPTPMMVIGAYAGGSVLLYALTRGREFAIAAASSVLFLAPFVRLG